MDYGLQLCCVRDIGEVSYEKMLESVSQLGYKYVEAAGFYNNKSEDIKRWLDKYDLKMSGTHSSFEELENDFKGTVKFHQTIGNTRYIIPGIEADTRESLDIAVEKFNKYGHMLKENGITIGYHNHRRDFLINNDGICPILYLAEKTDVKFEFDMFWVYVADKNPVTILEKYRDKLIGCVHIKDGRVYPKIKGCALGEGSAPVRDVIAKAKDMKLLMVIESEGLDPTGIGEVGRCMNFLKNNDLEK